MRRVVVVAISLAVVTSVITFASPADATVNNRNVQCDFFGNVTLSPSTPITGAVNTDTVAIGNLAGITSVTVSSSGVSGPATIASSDTFPVVYTINSSSPSYIVFTVVISPGGACDGKSVTLSINGGAPGPTPTSSSTVVAPPPVYALSLTGSDSTASCSVPAPSADEGSWVTLPAAKDCVRIGANVPAGSVLLGWSTSKSFPIAIAQHQVDMGWMQWDGEVNGKREIFIPAGGGAFLTSDNTLYPVWSR